MKSIRREFRELGEYSVDELVGVVRVITGPPPWRVQRSV